MEVRMKSIMAGPGGIANPGQVIDVVPQVAKNLVAGGYAEMAIIEPPETMDARPVKAKGRSNKNEQ